MRDLTMNDAFRQAASGALAEWGLEDGLDDLIQDLWVWYLESPATQTYLEESDYPEQVWSVRKRCHQILSGKVLAADLVQGKRLYSTDSIREALHGMSTNRYLAEILPAALRTLQHQDEAKAEAGHPRGYAEAIRSRYEDRVVPVRNTPQENRLSRALKALTDEVNVFYLTAEDNTRGVPAEFRKRKGAHGDPTAHLAIALLEHGDDEIELCHGGFTTYRKEFYEHL